MGYANGMGAVVTGGGSGLGRALALDLAKRRARVLVSDIDEAKMEETAEAIRRAGAEAFTHRCDVGRWDEVQALEAAAREALGDVDLVCNNAGVAVGGPFEEIPIEDWHWCVDIDLYGVVYGCRAFLPGMRERGRGHVLNVASAAGLVSTPELSTYNVCKAGVVALTETLYGEYKKHGVKLTVLCPTFFKTGILDAARGSTDAKAKGVASKLMERSKIQAPDVARIALDDLEKGRLYSVPMRDGRQMWRLRRLAPQPFYDMLSGGRERLEMLLKRGR